MQPDTNMQPETVVFHSRDREAVVLGLEFDMEMEKIHRRPHPMIPNGRPAHIAAKLPPYHGIRLADDLIHYASALLPADKLRSLAADMYRQAKAVGELARGGDWREQDNQRQNRPLRP